MSADDTSPEPDRAPVLRREALLPNERSRGLGTIAVVCTMAGVASGLALATTLMAMQVADSMSVHQCPYHTVMQEPIDIVRTDHAFLGIRFVFHDGYGDIDRVLPNTPAEANDFRIGDHVLSIDGYAIKSSNDLQNRIYNSQPGAQVSVVVERGDQRVTLHPTLVAWPVISY